MPSYSRIGYDGTFELDAFAKPRIRNESELVKNTLLYILFSKPGQYPSLPFIGLDIENLLYSLYDDLDVTQLADDIIYQCAALGVYFKNGTINIKKTKYENKPSLMIHIETYHSDDVTKSAKAQRYQIGLTFNELNDMIYNVTEGSV